MAESKQPQPFLDIMKTGWAEIDDNHFAPLPNAEYHARRRNELGAQFPGETLVIPTGRLKVRSNDDEYGFRPGSDFAYLTGYYEPDAVLVLTPNSGATADSTTHHATLYLRATASRDSTEFFLNTHGELWHGRRHTLRGYQLLYTVDCADLATLPAVLEKCDPQNTRVRRGFDATIDAAITCSDDGKRDQELARILAEMRLTKDEWEIEQLRDAMDATARGFTDVVRALPADREVSERLVEGVFALRARHDGNGIGYGTISAAGVHACTLHWLRNDGPVRPGDLLLLDAGVENQHLYTADVTRTMPVSGRFSPAQRQIYDIVYASQQAGFAAIKPGVRWIDVHNACMQVLAEGLADLGILPIPVDEALKKENQTYRRWTLHQFGHMLGIDVHDCVEARKEVYREGPLEAGYVLTVEPGLYFQPDDLLVPEEYRGIGIRIEDDVLVTADGCEVLSAELPTQADELEMWMAELRAAGPRLPD